MNFFRILSLSLLTVGTLFWTGCGGGGGGPNISFKNCPDGSIQTSAAPCPNKPGGNTGNQAGEVAQAAVDGSRAAALLNVSSELNGQELASQDNGPKAQAATAASGNPGKNPPNPLKSSADLKKIKDLVFGKPKTIGNAVPVGGSQTGTNTANVGLPGEDAQKLLAPTALEQPNGGSGGYGGGGATGARSEGKSGGRGLSGLFGKNSATLGSSGEMNVFGPQAGRGLASAGGGTGDPDDYFARTRINENLFKKISLRYGEVSTHWSVEDSRAMAQ